MIFLNQFLTVCVVIGLFGDNQVIFRAIYMMQAVENQTSV